MQGTVRRIGALRNQAPSDVQLRYRSTLYELPTYVGISVGHDARLYSLLDDVEEWAREHTNAGTGYPASFLLPRVTNR